MIDDVSVRQPLPSEVVALCALLARIMYRCLTEQDQRLLGCLQVSTESTSESTVEKSEVTHGQAA